MKTAILKVGSPDESMAGFLQSWMSGKPERNKRIAFATPEILWRVLTAKRWKLLKALCSGGPMSTREAACRVKRDVKAVHADITAFLSAGVIARQAALLISRSRRSRLSFCLRRLERIPTGT